MKLSKFFEHQPFLFIGVLANVNEKRTVILILVMVWVLYLYIAPNVLAFLIIHYNQKPRVEIKWHLCMFVFMPE